MKGYLNGSNRNRLRRCGLEWSGVPQGHVAGCCEPLGSIKYGEFLDQLNNC